MAARAALANQTGRGFRELIGVVVNAGKMDRTVTVRVGGQKWNKKLQKYFKTPQTHLVHDPNNSLCLGDVLAIQPGWRTSRHKRHVVSRMILPAGIPMHERNPIPTEDERIAAKEEKQAAKKARKAANRQARYDAWKHELEVKKAKERKIKREQFVHSGMGTLLKEKGELEAKLAELNLLDPEEKEGQLDSDKTENAEGGVSAEAEVSTEEEAEKEKRRKESDLNSVD